jgi:hypothetical protein
MRIVQVFCFCLIASCLSLRAEAPSDVPPDSAKYRADVRLRGPYWEGYATVLRQQLAALAEGHSSITRHITEKSEEDDAWHAGYRDGLLEASRMTQKTKDPQQKPKDK